MESLFWQSVYAQAEPSSARRAKTAEYHVETEDEKIAVKERCN